VPDNTLTIIDDRTGKTITVPITNGTFPAVALREIDPSLEIVTFDERILAEL